MSIHTDDIAGAMANSIGCQLDGSERLHGKWRLAYPEFDVNVETNEAGTIMGGGTPTFVARFSDES